MKVYLNLIVFAVLIFTTRCSGIWDGGYETITVAGEEIQIAKEDFPQKMSNEDAITACENLGEGWRLPTETEGKAIEEQLINKGKGNFNSTEKYWTSTESRIYGNSYIVFGGGKEQEHLPGLKEKSSISFGRIGRIGGCFVRAVRPVK